MNWIEILGTFASVVVALSLTIRNMKGLRIVNTLGAAAFAVYGLLIASWPVLGLNAFIVVINIFYLWRMSGETAHFQVLNTELAPGLLKEFETFYREDIHRFQPGFQMPEEKTGIRGAFILREAVPISLMMFRESPAGEWEVLLDYAIPSYRDYKNARFFFSKGFSAVFPGILPVFFVRSRVRVHKNYLKKVGFSSVGSDTGEALFIFQTRDPGESDSK